MSLKSDVQALFFPVSQTNIHPWRVGVLIAGVYMLLGGAYIILSSTLVADAADSVTSLRLSELHKGLIFIGVTGLLLLLFITGVLKNIAQKNEKIINQRHALLLSERQAIAGMLASSVAHDINNVLTVLVNNIDMAEYRLPDSSETREFLDQLRQSGDHLEDLSTSLLRAGRTVRQNIPEPFNMQELVQEAFAFSRTHNAVQYCTMHVECPDDVQMVGFPLLLKPMLFNLILNAAEAIQGTGTIDVQVTKKNNHIEITVDDDGPGIPPDEREQIFDPFYTTKKDGTGLGMLSIQASVEAHKGTMSIAESPLGGARFTITLPVELSDSE